MTQKQFERLSKLMADKGVAHEAFELLADLRQSEQMAKEEVKAIKYSIIDTLEGFTDFENLPVSEMNYLQVIRKMKSMLEWIPVEERLPEEGEKVLVYRPNAYMSYDNEIRIVSRNENFAHRKNNNFFNCVCKVTHWLPLPPLPEDV